MRILICAPLLAALTLVTAGCVMQSDGQPVLRITAPPGTECEANNNSLILSKQGRTVEIWLVPGASTIDEALARRDDTIKGEFKNFKLVKSTDLTIAGSPGSPARRQVGTGNEADDDDPGEADLIICKIGPRIFIACTHGEDLNPQAQEWMLTLLQSAQTP